MVTVFYRKVCLWRTRWRTRHAHQTRAQGPRTKWKKRDFFRGRPTQHWFFEKFNKKTKKAIPRATRRPRSSRDVHFVANRAAHLFKISANMHKYTQICWTNRQTYQFLRKCMQTCTTNQRHMQNHKKYHQIYMHMLRHTYIHLRHTHIDNNKIIKYKLIWRYRYNSQHLLNSFDFKQRGPERHTHTQIHTHTQPNPT